MYYDIKYYENNLFKIYFLITIISFFYYFIKYMIYLIKFLKEINIDIKYHHYIITIILFCFSTSILESYNAYYTFIHVYYLYILKI